MKIAKSIFTAFKTQFWRRIEVVVTGLTRNQLYLLRYRGFESHRLRHIMARCEPQNKKATSVAFFILLLFARHYNCSDGGRPKYVTLDFHLAIPSLRSLRIPPSPPNRVAFEPAALLFLYQGSCRYRNQYRSLYSPMVRLLLDAEKR